MMTGLTRLDPDPDLDPGHDRDPGPGRGLDLDRGPDLCPDFRSNYHSEQELAAVADAAASFALLPASLVRLTLTHSLIFQQLPEILPTTQLKRQSSLPTT